MRTWLVRLGVAALQAPIKEGDDWICMADHSNQIGQKKALAVIGIRASNLPAPGVAIRRKLERQRSNWWLHQFACLLRSSPQPRHAGVHPNRLCSCVYETDENMGQPEFGHIVRLKATDRLRRIQKSRIINLRNKNLILPPCIRPALAQPILYWQCKLLCLDRRS